MRCVVVYPRSIFNPCIYGTRSVFFIPFQLVRRGKNNFVTSEKTTLESGSLIFPVWFHLELMMQDDGQKNCVLKLAVCKYWFIFYVY